MSDLTGGVASRPNEIAPPLVGMGLPELEVFGSLAEGYSLSVLVSAQPTVLLFYRGGW